MCDRYYSRHPCQDLCIGWDNASWQLIYRLVLHLQGYGHCFLVLLAAVPLQMHTMPCDSFLWFWCVTTATAGQKAVTGQNTALK